MSSKINHDLLHFIAGISRSTDSSVNLSAMQKRFHFQSTISCLKSRFMLCGIKMHNNNEENVPPVTMLNIYDVSIRERMLRWFATLF